VASNLKTLVGDNIFFLHFCSPNFFLKSRSGFTSSKFQGACQKFRFHHLENPSDKTWPTLAALRALRKICSQLCKGGQQTKPSKKGREQKNRGKNGVPCQLFMPFGQRTCWQFCYPRRAEKKGAFSMGVEGNRGDKLLSKQRQLK